MYFEAQYAKNIAMASENIVSISLSQYELFINLLNELKIKINKISFKNRNNILSCVLSLSDKNHNNIEIYSFVGDAIILSLKTFSNIYIDESFLLDINYNNTDDDSLEKFYFENHDTRFSKGEKTAFESVSSKVSILESALNECVSNENYEAAAILRDRIKQLKNQ